MQYLRMKTSKSPLFPQDEGSGVWGSSGTFCRSTGRSCNPAVLLGSSARTQHPLLLRLGFPNELPNSEPAFSVKPFAYLWPSTTLADCSCHTSLTLFYFRLGLLLFGRPSKPSFQDLTGTPLKSQQLSKKCFLFAPDYSWLHLIKTSGNNPPNQKIHSNHERCKPHTKKNN